MLVSLPMKVFNRDRLVLLLFGLLSGCEKESLQAEPAASAKAEAKDEAAEVGAEEVVPAGSSSAGKQKTCAPGGCAPGKCGGSE